MTELQIKSYHSTFSQAFAKPPARVGIKHATWQLMPNHFIIHRSEILLLPENHKVHKNSIGCCQPDLPTWLPAKLLCHAQPMGQTHSPHHISWAFIALETEWCLSRLFQKHQKQISMECANMGAYWHNILIYHLGNNQILGKIFQTL